MKEAVSPHPYGFTGERVTTEMTRITLREILSHLFRGDKTPLQAFILAQEHLGRYKFTVRSLDLTRKIVLDLAGGDGYGSSLLKEIGHPQEVVSIDIDLPTTRSAHLTHGESVDFVNADAQNLPFPDASFPVVTSFETYEHLARPKQFLSEISRVLTPDGILVISTPNRNISNPRTSRSSVPANPFHRFEVSPQEFIDDLKPHFRDITLYGQRFKIKPAGERRTVIDRLRNLSSVLTGEISRVHSIPPFDEPTYMVAVCQNPIQP